MLLSDDGGAFSVEVIDAGPLEDDPSDSTFRAFDATSSSLDGDEIEGVPAGFGLVVIGGLVDEVSIANDGSGTHVRMAWPVEARDIRI
jgi:anti-sigma regulatory factor (Ser/Thr protein kinase)